MNRQEANKKLLDLIEMASRMHPELRFIQLLVFLKIDDARFYEESSVILARAEAALGNNDFVRNNEEYLSTIVPGL